MDHSHSQVQMKGRFVLSLALTGVIFLAEVGGGIWTGSLSLLSDAAHVFLDAFALALSYVALRLSERPPDDRHTYGYHRAQVLAALANGASLLVVAVGIFREAWSRLREPADVLAGPMLVVAVVGLVVNLLVALVLREHEHGDINVRSAFLHVLGDALASVGVIAAGVVIAVTGWTTIDPLVSIVIGAIILIGAGRLVLRSVHILTEGMPGDLTASEVGETMRSVSGVKEVHDLHVWTVSPGYVALSAHVVLADQALSETAPVMAALRTTLSEQFGIQHTTIQFECASCTPDALMCRFDASRTRDPGIHADHTNPPGHIISESPHS
jgi:cobalt-zinc-cadmium efflux system protein